MDKFADVLLGFPVEIQTDCQALRDTLINESSLQHMLGGEMESWH
jgi:hypothetical protein